MDSASDSESEQVDDNDSDTIDEKDNASDTATSTSNKPQSSHSQKTSITRAMQHRPMIIPPENSVLPAPQISPMSKRADLKSASMSSNATRNAALIPISLDDDSPEQDMPRITVTIRRLTPKE